MHCDIKDRTIAYIYADVKGNGEFKKLKSYDRDIFLSYFWQQADSRLVQWVSRKHTLFFAGMSAVIGVYFATLVSHASILHFQLEATFANIVVLIASGLFVAILYYNAQCERKAALQMIDVWLMGILDPTKQKPLKDIVRQIK